MATVLEANDAAHVRNMRLRRGIEKLRLERAFLLEQLERRVKPSEESEGSPSPPPTVGIRNIITSTATAQTRGEIGLDDADESVQPKSKPLRTKRGRRAPEPATSLQYENSMAMSQDDGDTVQNSFNDSMVVDEKPDSKIYGDRSQSPKSAFDLFARSARSFLLVRFRKEIKANDPKIDLNGMVWKQWQEMPQSMKRTFEKDFQDGNLDRALNEDQRKYIDVASNSRPEDGGARDDSPDETRSSMRS